MVVFVVWAVHMLSAALHKESMAVGYSIPPCCCHHHNCKPPLPPGSKAASSKAEDDGRSAPLGEQHDAAVALQQEVAVLRRGALQVRLEQLQRLALDRAPARRVLLRLRLRLRWLLRLLWCWRRRWRRGRRRRRLVEMRRRGRRLHGRWRWRCCCFISVGGRGALGRGGLGRGGHVGGHAWR